MANKITLPILVAIVVMAAILSLAYKTRNTCGHKVEYIIKDSSYVDVTYANERMIFATNKTVIDTQFVIVDGKYFRVVKCPVKQDTGNIYIGASGNEIHSISR